jgi:uncharacterized repeat protein (TIGR01451 family)
MFKFTKLFTLLLLLDVSCAFALDTPTQDFIDNNDGTVTHKKTGLTWQRCSVGQTWTGSSCSGSASNFSWNNAMKQTSNFAGYNDWRLPRLDELFSIVEFSASTPAINTTIFPNTGQYSAVWSSELRNFNPDCPNDCVVLIYFNYGYSSSGDRKDYDYGVGIRFVRNQNFNVFSGEYTPTNDFIDNGDGTVKHKKTNLVWQRCVVGQTWNGLTCIGSPSMFTYAQAIAEVESAFAKNGWRLPTLSEFQTIMEYSKFDPSVNTNIFPTVIHRLPDPISNSFWTSTVNASDQSYMWTTNFFSGYPYFNMDKNKKNTIRLVATTLTAISSNIDLSSTLSQSSSRVKINENFTYTATVTNNGTGTANNSLLKIYLPPRNVSIFSMPSDCVTTGKSITCSLGNLAAGVNASRAITVTYIKSGGASVSALVLTDSDDTNSANNVSRIVTAITK